MPVSTTDIIKGLANRKVLYVTVFGLNILLYASNETH